MKKWIVLLAVLSFVGVVYADQSSVLVTTSLSGVFSMQGKPGATKSVTVDNTAKSIKTLIEAASGAFYGGTDSSLVPIGILMSCEGETRWAFGGTSPTQAGVGHKLPADSSWSWSNPQMIGAMTGISTDNTNDTCQITLSY